VPLLAVKIVKMEETLSNIKASLEIPYLTGEVNISPDCYGCREATNTSPEHMFMGIAAKLIPEIVGFLEYLSKKAMPTVREKRVYEAYIKRKYLRIRGCINDPSG